MDAVEWSSRSSTNAKVPGMTQFTLRRLFVAIALIAVGCSELGHIYSIRNRHGPLTALEVLAIVTCLPAICAGLLTPFKRPILGAFLGLLCFVVMLIWLASRSMGV